MFSLFQIQDNVILTSKNVLLYFFFAEFTIGEIVQTMFTDLDGNVVWIAACITSIRDDQTFDLVVLHPELHNVNPHAIYVPLDKIRKKSLEVAVTTFFFFKLFIQVLPSKMFCFLCFLIFLRHSLIVKFSGSTAAVKAKQKVSCPTRGNFKKQFPPPDFWSNLGVSGSHLWVLKWWETDKPIKKYQNRI